MKTIHTVLLFIVVRLGIASRIAVEAARIAGREEHPGARSRFARWVAVLTLAIALAPDVASAQEDGTITISGLFSMDYEFDVYYFAPEILPVYYNGHEHTWTLSLHGTSLLHSTNGSSYRTDIHATSFALEFFGPDAATLNAFVSDQLAEQDVNVRLQNTYDENGGGLAIMQVGVGYSWIGYPYFFSGHDIYSGNDIGVDTLFPADADGYPIVSSEPFSIEPDYTELAISDLFSGWYAGMGSLTGLVTFKRMSNAPALTITSSNNVVMVSWPSPSTGFTLQQKNQLNTTNWVTPTETVTDTGIIKFITVDPPMGSRFYRLFKP